MNTSNSYHSLGQVILKTSAILVALCRLTLPTKFFCRAQCFFHRRHRIVTTAPPFSAQIDDFCLLFLFQLARKSQTATAGGVRVGDDSFCQ